MEENKTTNAAPAPASPAALSGDKERAYDSIDRFLRNNLCDEDYAEYSAELDSLLAAQPADGDISEDERLRNMVRAAIALDNNSEREADRAYARQVLADVEAIKLDTPVQFNLGYGSAVQEIRSRLALGGWYDSKPPAEDAATYLIAANLATAIWQAHWQDVSPNWRPLETLDGVLTQISNMVSGMERQRGLVAEDARASRQCTRCEYIGRCDCEPKSADTRQGAALSDEQTRAQLESLARHSYGGRFAVYMSGDDARALLDSQPAASAHYEALEREHLGDFDKKTGIYAAEDARASRCTECNGTGTSDGRDGALIPCLACSGPARQGVALSNPEPALVVVSRFVTDETDAYLDKLRFAASEAIRTFEDAGDAMSWSPTIDAIERLKGILHGGYEYHSDDAAVDAFAWAMRDKMEESREKGRSGWDSPFQCSPERLAEMLIDHISKGDPVDVGNFAMMLFNRPDARGVLAKVWEARASSSQGVALSDENAIDDLLASIPEVCKAERAVNDFDLHSAMEQAFRAIARRVLSRASSSRAEVEQTVPVVTEDMVRSALSVAWNDFVSDTGCYPSCFTVQRGKRIEADFERAESAFLEYAAATINASLAAAEAPNAEGKP